MRRRRRRRRRRRAGRTRRLRRRRGRRCFPAWCELQQQVMHSWGKQEQSHHHAGMHDRMHAHVAAAVAVFSSNSDAHDWYLGSRSLCRGRLVSREARGSSSGARAPPPRPPPPPPPPPRPPRTTEVISPRELAISPREVRLQARLQARLQGRARRRSRRRGCPLIITPRRSSCRPSSPPWDGAW